MDASLTLSILNSCTQRQFVEAVGWVFEESLWVAERAWYTRPFTSVDVLIRVINATVAAAAVHEQLSFLRAHPELGAGNLRGASAREQSAAGLAGLMVQDRDLFADLNARYRARFGFPFLLAVKDRTPREVLCSLQRRLNAMPAEEFQEALKQACRITELRLREIFY